MSKNFILNLMSILISTLIMCYIIPNLIFVILFCVISLSYLIFIYFIDKKYTYKISRFSECCNFIENTIISFNFVDSTTAALDNAKKKLNKKTLENFDENNKNSEDLLYFLDKHYTFNIFNIFKQCLKIFEDVGGNFLNISKNLLNETKRLSYLNIKTEKESVSYLFSFISMWLFAFLILLVAKLSLGNFTSEIIESLYFKIVSFCGFLFYIVSLYLYMKRLYKTDYILEYKL